MADTMSDTMHDSAGGITREKAPEPTFGDTPITGDRYTSVEFARKEWERMWTRTWQIAGRVDQIPEPGDYLTYEIGVESIICVRGSDMRIRAFYNVCQHRGNQLVTAEAGTLASGEFQCAYHGWRFSDAGELTWVHDADDFPQGDPCGKRNLVEMPCDTWGGFVWFNMDPTCRSLREELAPVADHLDCYRMETMKRTHWITVEGDWNWKCVQDNFNESYHLPFVHPQTLASMNEHHTGCQFDMYPNGHARMLMPGGGPGPHYRGQVRSHVPEPGAGLRVLGVRPGALPRRHGRTAHRAAEAQARAGRREGLRLLLLHRRAAHRPLPLHGVPQHLVLDEARRLHLAARRAASERRSRTSACSTCGISPSSPKV